MSDGRDGQVWSDTLARALLDDLPDEAITGFWETAGDRSAGQLRVELTAWARDDAEVRRWITAAWRDRHEPLVDESESYAPEELAARGAVLWEQFGDALLLALLTDEAARGADLAETFIAHLASARHRQLASAVLTRLLGGAPAAPQTVKRVVVFGGHPRDAANLDEPLSSLGPFDIRWETFERTGAGGSADTRSIATSLVGADAAIIVLGMASHALASVVRSHAQASGIPCRTINRATRRQLTESLSGLFPECLPPGL